MIEYFTLVEAQKGVELFPPVLHIEDSPLPRLIFGKIQVHDHDSVEFIEFIGVQVVFGNRYVLLAYF